MHGVENQVLKLDVTDGDTQVDIFLLVGPLVVEGELGFDGTREERRYVYVTSIFLLR